ncbi:MAG: c-type cytochrome [Balneolaceae bacterium]
MRLSKLFSTATLLLAAVTLVSCRGQISDKPPIQLQRNMMQQDRFNAQQENTFFEDNRSMRLPVEGTIARGEMRENLEYHEGIDESGEFTDQIPVELTRSFLYRGKERYDIFCATCHGGTGDGRGIIITGQYGYVPPPSFHDNRILEMPDGEIYSAIYNGVRTMPSYRSQVPVQDRWAIVAYIRALQSSQNVPEAEMEQYDVDLSELQRAWTEEQELLAAREAEREAAAGPPAEASADRGRELFTQQGCQACHSTDGVSGIGPTLADLYQKEVELQDGSTVTADEEYLRESIVEPSAKISAGYPAAMPPFAHLADDEIDSLIEYIETLSNNE